MNRWLQFVDRRQSRGQIVVGNTPEARESIRRIEKALRTVPAELVVQLGYQAALRQWMLPEDYAVMREKNLNNVWFPVQYRNNLIREREARAAQRRRARQPQ